MFEDGIDPVEFKVGIVFRNMKSFAWALQDFYIQECFRGRRLKFKRRRILCRRYASKCPFKVYALLQRHGECFQTKSFHDVHTCQGIVKNPEATLFGLSGSTIRKSLLILHFLWKIWSLTSNRYMELRSVHRRLIEPKEKLLSQ